MASNAQRSDRARSIRLDAIDRRIIDILQGSSKITNAALSDTVGISAPSTLERVRKLESAGVITGYVALVDPAALNKAITALVQVSLNSHSNASLERAKSLLGSFDEVLACWHTAGDEDFVLKVLVCDMAAYERFISHKLSTVPGISKIRTAFVLSAVKESTRIPLNDGELENNGCAAPRRDRKNRES